MPIPYDQLYHYLVSQVDDVITYMLNAMTVEQAADYDHMRVAAERLHAALNECEERYLAAGEAESGAQNKIAAMS